MTKEAAQFIEQYALAYESYKELAELAESFIREKLQDREYSLHLVTGRAKHPESLRGKVVEKGYADPKSSITDLIGIRVITYYSEEVDAIAERLRLHLVVDKQNSLDKRAELVSEDHFGYRSVHVLGHVSRRADVDAKFIPLRGRVIEVQVRTVLDHAWAEIEHELVYKSGFVHPKLFRRRFAAVAGAFEILEHEFLALKSENQKIVDTHRGTYAAGREASARFDAARMIAALEVLEPNGDGWRQAELGGAPFVVSPRTALAALRSVDLDNYRSLKTLLRRRPFVEVVEGYAALTGIAPAQVSHLSLVSLMVGFKDAEALDDFFPELVGYLEIRTALGIEL